MMDTATILLLMALSVFSGAQCEEDLGDKNPLWSSLTPLQIAAMEGRAEEVEDILEEKREPVDGRSGMSPLHWAALTGHVPVIRVLLRFGADVRSLDDENNTALHMAAAGGNAEAVQELALARVDLNARNSKNSTALHLAVAKEDFQVVKKLLRFGALTNVTDSEGRSPLDIAVETNNIITSALLRSSGAEKVKYAVEREDNKTTTPRPTLVTTTTKRPFIELSKATRRPEIRNLTEKEKSMHQAAKYGNDEKIAELCAEGVDPNVADPENGFTPLHLAAANNFKEAIMALARCSANLNAKDLSGNTPLHIAVTKDYPWPADLLIMLGADPSIANNAHKVPQDLLTAKKNPGFKATFKPDRVKWIRGIRTLSASERNLLQNVKIGYYLSVADLCKNGVDVRVKDVDNKEYTMLHHAVSISYNVHNMLQMLLRCGADINARDSDGNTPLHIAAYRDIRDAQRVLLLNGADPFIANAEGKTAYQILKESSPDGLDNRIQWYMNRMLF